MPLAEEVDGLSHALVSHEIPVHGFFPGTLEQGFDSLVLPLCCAALLHPKGKMMFLKIALVMQWLLL